LTAEYLTPLFLWLMKSIVPNFTMAVELVGAMLLVVKYLMMARRQQWRNNVGLIFHRVWGLLCTHHSLLGYFPIQQSKVCKLNLGSWTTKFNSKYLGNPKNEKAYML
jgi:hypothetical protein